MIETVKSVNGIPIRLPTERWKHILKRHHFEDLLEVILTTVQDPLEVYIPMDNPSGQYMARNSQNRISTKLTTDNLIVHYKETSKSNGFIITAHLISNDRFKRMIKNWKRVYP
jgi:hypothetical protein